MLLEIINEGDFASGKKIGRPRKIYLFACDECGTQFKRKKINRKVSSFVFCKRECASASRSHGILRKKMETTCLERYGQKFTIHTENAREKRLAVDDQAKVKRRATMLKLYGVATPMESSEIMKKIRMTTLQRHGVEFFSQSDQWYDLCEQNSLERFGTNWPSQSNEVKTKMVDTCLQKYGVSHVFQASEIKKAILNSYIERWGCHVSAHPDIIKKKHETMKRNGTYGKSKSEDMLYVLLCEKFGDEKVKRQVDINGWSIDFYVETIDIYIQFDGVYWHGLDRSLDEIRQFTSSRDAVIYETYLRDREQEKWFDENQLCLIRLTDVDLGDL
jgi:very-short-patch-repair endonuclease